MTDPIADLVDWQLTQKPKHSGGTILTPTDRCTRCNFGWHGLPKAGCKGAYQED